MKEIVNNSNQDVLKLEEEQVIDEKIKKIEHRYKVFKKITLIIAFIAGIFAAVLGHKIGTKLSSDNKYKLDNEFDMFDDSTKEKNNDEQTSGKNKDIPLKKYTYAYKEKNMTEEEVDEFMEILIFEKSNIKLCHNQLEQTLSKKLTKNIQIKS